jgi:hypothetical protein
MDISGVSIPQGPEVQPQPPRDAQLETAVAEVTESENQGTNTQADTGSSSARQDNFSNLGRHVDERA